MRAMSVLDVIITKATRSNSGDIADISECSRLVSIDDVLKRVKEYSLDSDERVKETVFDALS